MHNSSTSRRLGLKVALVGAGVAAGAITASAFAANAATTSASGSTATYGSSATPAPAHPRNGQPPANAHGAQPVRIDEKSVSAALAAKLEAAALKAVPGGTVYRVETDSGDAVYEAHMTNSDGTDVTVKFDKNLNLTGVEAGIGQVTPP
jgi:hypothetical protein